MELLPKINDFIWNPMAYFALAVGLFFTILTAGVIMTEAGLSFLGLGVPPPTATWGSMLAEAQSLRILESMPWMWLPPGIALATVVMAVNFIGDGLRDAVDPRQGR